MDKKTRDLLAKPLTEYDRPGAGGRKFKYVKGEDVIGRLNTAFDNEWNSHIIESWVTEDKPKQVMVLVEVSAGGATHQGFGGAEIAVYTQGPKAGQPVDISNSYKSALTGAIKNAAKLFGIGLLSDETDLTFSDDDTSIPTSPTITPPSTSSVENADNIEKIRSILEGAGTAKPQPTSGGNTASLAESYKQSIGASTGVKDTEIPFKPSVSTTDKINDVQIGAMNAMSKMKQLEPGNVIKAALGSTGKTDFGDLTVSEAKLVLKHLHSTTKGA